jgi:hypothetical protein
MSSSAVTTARPELGAAWGILHKDKLCNPTVRIKVCKGIQNMNDADSKEESKRVVPLEVLIWLDLIGDNGDEEEP